MTRDLAQVLSYLIPFLSIVATLVSFGLFVIRRWFSRLDDDVSALEKKLEQAHVAFHDYEQRMRELLDAHNASHVHMQDDILNCKNRSNRLESRCDGLESRVSTVERADRDRRRTFA